MEKDAEDAAWELALAATGRREEITRKYDGARAERYHEGVQLRREATAREARLWDAACAETEKRLKKTTIHYENHPRSIPG